MTTYLFKRDIGGGYAYKETITDGANGTSIIIPAQTKDTTNQITCTIIAGANTGKFQFTTSLEASIMNTTCTWIDWPKGLVTGTDYDVIEGPVTGIRGVSSSGEIIIEIVR